MTVAERARVTRSDALQCGGHEAAQRAGDGPDPQARVLVAQDLVELRRGEVEALRDGVGVGEQGFAGAGEARAAGAAREQLAADLALELGDLVGDGGLGEGEGAGGARERALVGDLRGR